MENIKLTPLEIGPLSPMDADNLGEQLQALDVEFEIFRQEGPFTPVSLTASNHDLYFRLQKEDFQKHFDLFEKFGLASTEAVIPSEAEAPELKAYEPPKPRFSQKQLDRFSTVVIAIGIANSLIQRFVLGPDSKDGLPFDSLIGIVLLLVWVRYLFKLMVWLKKTWT